MTHHLHKGKPKVADVTTLAVLQAYDRLDRRRKVSTTYPWPTEELTDQFQCHGKVTDGAIVREVNRGYIEYGVTMRSGWLTREGKAKLAELLNPTPPEKTHADEG